MTLGSLGGLARWELARVRCRYGRSREPARLIERQPRILTSEFVLIHSTQIITVVCLLPADPLVTIDQEGVGELVKLVAERSKAMRKVITLGICGKHGGDHFCQSVELDYVSCSPYRVPIVRLGATI